MNKFILVALAGVISGAFITTQLTDPLIAQETKRVKSTYENLDLFGDIFERIRSSYVEEIVKRNSLKVQLVECLHH